MRGEKTEEKEVFLVLPRPANSIQNGAEKLREIGPNEKKKIKMPQSEQFLKIPVQSLPKGKGNELSVQITKS